MEGKMIVQGMHKKTRSITFYTGQTKRSDGEAFITTAMFVLPGVSKDRVVLGGATFDDRYLKETFFPEMLEEMVTEKSNDQGGYKRAMMLYPSNMEMGQDIKPLASAPGWGQGKPEVSRKLDDVFRGLALGVKFQGTSVKSFGSVLGTPQFSDSRVSVSDDNRRTGADKAHGEQRNGAGPAEVRLCFQRLARVAHASGFDQVVR